jgi:phosphopantothenoylcysteine decarboxylase/phosphopantothenate--cysteine ligase
MRIVITAGPTREYIDAVRFISNPSTGKMGYAVAEEAARRGHEVILLSGPTCLDAPEGVATSYFEGVEELYSMVVEALPAADCLVMAAAVGDYKPAERFTGKRKKTATLTLQLVATRDIIKSVAPLKGDRIFIGFAVEVADPIGNARKKLAAKALDMVVQNAPESFGADRATFTLVFPGGEVRPLINIAKSDVAAAILDEIETLFRARKRA